jgi:rare lipoprotein A (peptidoglycan hydrolase)
MGISCANCFYIFGATAFRFDERRSRRTGRGLHDNAAFDAHAPWSRSHDQHSRSDRCFHCRLCFAEADLCRRQEALQGIFRRVRIWREGKPARNHSDVECRVAVAATRPASPIRCAASGIIPKEDKRYAKVGLASWYGDAFHGRLTANGEVYDMTHLTAAHPTMPLPSYARVTNLKNGSSVIVRVNDRGPYHEGRIIDVSERAAQMLDYANIAAPPM